MKQIKFDQPLEMVLNRAVVKIVHYCDPERIILFGSFSKGLDRNNSDIDLSVITETRQSLETRAMEWRAILHDILIPFDIIMLTPNEFEYGRYKKYSFVYCALKNGKILYEKA